MAGAVAYALVLFWLSLPSATTADAAEPQGVVAPERVDTTPVPYPPSAAGAAEVVLELVVDRDGAVSDSRVVEGVEPFAGAAREASARWRFTPAARDGRPIEARIRMRVTFVPPAPSTPAPAVNPPEGPRGGPPPPEGRAARHGDEGVAEVEVHGIRTEPGRQELSGAEVRQMPGSFGDAFRAIEAMPGVTPILSGLPYFLVRGAPPGNTGFFIDGVRVPALFHLGVLTAVVHPGIIDRVDLYPGGYPARFGRFTGGILSGETLPTADHPHGEASVRVFDAGALVSTPVADGRADVLASVRYGYPGPLLSVLAPTIGLAYWDYQTRAQWRPSERDQLGAFVFGSYDSLSQRDANTGVTSQLLGIQFHRIDLRWDRQTSATGNLRVALTLGYDRSAAGNGPPLGTMSAIESGTFGLRSAWSERWSESVEVFLGGDAMVEPFHVAIPTGSPAGDTNRRTFGVSNADFLQTDVNASVFGELLWRPASRVEIRPGARVDLFTSHYPGGVAPPGIGGASGADVAAVTLDPRLAVRWQATPTVAWTAALGIAHQPSNIPLPSPGLQFSQLSRGVQAAYHLSQGAEVQLPGGFTTTGEVFVHDYTGLADFFESCPQGVSTCNFNGRSVGVELLVRRALTARFTGWLSYTFSRTDRDAFYQGSWLRRPSEFDRPHVANLVVAADLGKRWRAGSRLVAYSGLPYSTTIEGGPPDARAPPFFRLDLRLEKRWRALGGTMTVVVEWLNALLSKEAFGTTCEAATDAPFGPSGPNIQCRPNEIGPISIPSIGLEGSW